MHALLNAPLFCVYVAKSAYACRMWAGSVATLHLACGQQWPSLLASLPQLHLASIPQSHLPWLCHASRNTRAFYFVRENARGQIFTNYVNSIDFISRYIHDSLGELANGGWLFFVHV